MPLINHNTDHCKGCYARYVKRNGVNHCAHYGKPCHKAIGRCKLDVYGPRSEA